MTNNSCFNDITLLYCTINDYRVDVHCYCNILLAMPGICVCVVLYVGMDKVVFFSVRELF